MAQHIGFCQEKCSICKENGTKRGCMGRRRFGHPDLHCCEKGHVWGLIDQLRYEMENCGRS